MIAIGLLLVRMLCDCFRPRQQLEAELIVLRHQLNILQRQAPRRLHLRWVDRALFIWLYRRYPCVGLDFPLLEPSDQGGAPGTDSPFRSSRRRSAPQRGTAEAPDPACTSRPGRPSGSAHCCRTGKDSL